MSQGYVLDPSDIEGSETVLLVEDEIALGLMIQEVLEDKGYRMLVAVAAQAAIDLAERYEGVIHVLLTDVVLPGMGGRELAVRLRERRPDLRVLYMSGYTEDSIDGRGTLEPGALLISKPFSHEALAIKLREALSTPPARS